MREYEFISPTGLQKFEKDRDQFYLNYLTEKRPPRSSQSRPASVGSAFDALVKGELAQVFTGESAKHLAEELMERQVEPENLDFARPAGYRCLKAYVQTGALTALIEFIREFGLPDTLVYEADNRTELPDGIKLRGIPDCQFRLKSNGVVILDWKVNGYCGKATTSPTPGYRLCRDYPEDYPKPSRSNGKAHKYFQPSDLLGVEVNQFPMDAISVDWADQLSIYSWIAGQPIGGSRCIFCIDQIVGPRLRVASHRTYVTVQYQQMLHQRLKVMRSILDSGYIFPELSRSESDAHCRELDRQALSMTPDGTPEGAFFAKCATSNTFYRGR